MTEKRKSFLFLIIFLLVNSFGISESMKDENYFVLKNEKKEESLETTEKEKNIWKVKKTAKKKFWKMKLK